MFFVFDQSRKDAKLKSDTFSSDSSDASTFTEDALEVYNQRTELKNYVVKDNVSER